MSFYNTFKNNKIDKNNDEIEKLFATAGTGFMNIKSKLKDRQAYIYIHLWNYIVKTTKYNLLDSLVDSKTNYDN